MGEFGAVAVISGNIIEQTQTATLYVEAAYKVCCCGCTKAPAGFKTWLQEYNTEGAFSAAVLLSALAMGTIVVKNFLEGQVAKDVS